MMHLFPFFNPIGSPLAKELENNGAIHRFFQQKVKLKYRYRVGLIFLGWPQLVFSSFRSAWSSLFSAIPKPEVLILNNHFEVGIFGTVLFLKKAQPKPLVVLIGFIYTTRQNAILRYLRRIYFDRILRLTDRIICYSQSELLDYQTEFPASRNKFRYIPYGLYARGEEKHQIDDSSPISKSMDYIIAAGRSGRDYTTLIETAQYLNLRIKIICDRVIPLDGIAIPENVMILNQCYNEEYIKELENAAIVVIPLSVDNISAGQMVLIQAMAYRKPIIITRTKTTEEYVQDGVECLLVEQKNPVDLRNAIQNLLMDAALATRLANGARSAYEQRYCMRAYVKNLLEAIEI